MFYELLNGGYRDGRPALSDCGNYKMFELLDSNRIKKILNRNFFRNLSFIPGNTVRYLRLFGDIKKLDGRLQISTLFKTFISEREKNVYP